MGNGLIVFSRYDSQRLPGKALTPIGGRALLGHVIDRARRVGPDVVVVVATSERDVDNAIAEFADQEGVSVFRGSDTDVALRALECARTFGFDRFARVSGDSPYFDPDLAARLMLLHEEGGLQLATNLMPRTFPSGNSIEVIATQAMALLVRRTTDVHDREHVTPYFYRNRTDFVIENVASNDDLSGLHLAVDTKDDLDKARFIAAHATCAAAELPFCQIVSLAKEWEQIAQTAGNIR